MYSELSTICETALVTAEYTVAYKTAYRFEKINFAKIGRTNSH
jgi:hypothetical protein